MNVNFNSARPTSPQMLITAATADFQGHRNFFRLSVSVLTPTHSSCIIICSYLQQKQKNHPETVVEVKAAQKPTQMRSCLSLMVNQTAISERLWFVLRVYPGKPAEGGPQSAVGCCYPVIDSAACNFQAGRPTSHNIHILLCAFYNINAEILLNKPSLVQALVSLCITYVDWYFD